MTNANFSLVLTCDVTRLYSFGNIIVFIPQLNGRPYTCLGSVEDVAPANIVLSAIPVPGGGEGGNPPPASGTENIKKPQVTVLRAIF